MVCKALLERCSVDEQSSLLALVPRQERRLIETLPSAALPSAATPYPSPLSRIHPSWLAPRLRMLSKQDLRLCISALDSTQIEGLRSLLGWTESPLPLTEWGTEFVQNVLLQQLQEEQDILPLSLLPPSELTPLLTLSYKQLLRLIRFLGLFDLSFEMRQMIATAQIKQLLSALDAEEQAILKEIGHLQDNLIFKRLFLQGWDGSRGMLLRLLEERGMQRLAIVLHTQSPSLIWYVAHAFDVKSATDLLKLCKEPHEIRTTRLLIDQTLLLLTKVPL